MFRRALIPIAALGSAFIAGCGFVGGVFGARGMYEEPAFRVSDRLSEEIEIREYPARLAAEVEIDPAAEGDPEGEAFRVLFDYIQGANRAQREVAMTVPVEMAPAEEIAMTVPVEMGPPGSEGRSMRFFLPSEFTRETAPEPTDSRVQLLELPPATLAVLRWRGSMTEEAFETHRAALRKALEGSRWIAAGEPAALVYDPPFAIPALRRSEVAIPVVQRPPQDANRP